MTVLRHDDGVTFCGNVLSFVCGSKDLQLS
jgi:hypothetical protein